MIADLANIDQSVYQRFAREQQFQGQLDLPISQGPFALFKLFFDLPKSCQAEGELRVTMGPGY